MAEAQPIGGQGVALGREGTGLAQGLGQTVSPLQLYISERDKRAGMDATQAVARKKARDKDINDTMDFDPGETWVAAYANVENFTQKNVRDWAIDQFNQGYDTNQISKQLGQRQSAARKMAKKYKQYEGVHTEGREIIKNDKYLGDKNYYQSILNDRFFEEGDSVVKAEKDIDLEGIGGITDDSTGYNKDLIAADFMKMIPEQLISDFKRLEGKLGIEFQEDEFKSKLFLKHPDGSVMTDRFNNPLVGITPEVYNVAIQNRYIANTVNDSVGKDAPDEVKTQFIKEWFTPFDKSSEKHDIKSGFKYDQNDLHASGLTRKDQPRTKARFNTLYNAIWGYDKGALNNAFPGLKGKGATVSFDQSVKGGSPMTAGDIRPTAIIIDFNKKDDSDVFAGYIEETAFEQSDDGTIRIPIMDAEQKMAALHALNKVIDDTQKAAYQVGADNMAMLVDYLRATGQFGSSGGVYEKVETSTVDERGGIY